MEHKYRMQPGKAGVTQQIDPEGESRKCSRMRGCFFFFIVQWKREEKKIKQYSLKINSWSDVHQIVDFVELSVWWQNVVDGACHWKMVPNPMSPRNTGKTNWSREPTACAPWKMDGQDMYRSLSAFMKYSDPFSFFFSTFCYVAASC